MTVHTCRPLTEQEILTAGLLGHNRAPHLEAVDMGPPKGRGVVAREPIHKGHYVCEYRTHRVYPVGSAEEAQLAAEYEKNGEGSYVLYTAYVVPEFGARLCFDATRRFKDLGRLINHAPTGYNTKPGKPAYLRGKWRVGLMAVRDISEGEELTYDYGVRSERWMRRAGKGDSGGSEVKMVEESSGGSPGMKETAERAEETREVGKTSVKRNYFWCPELDCASGPVQKITQHLQKVHKMDSATAAKVAKRKRRAPLEAVRLKTPNPHTRSSGLQHLGLFTKKTTSTTTVTAGQSPAPPKGTPGTASSTPIPPCIPSTSGYDGNFHQAGPFLDGFYNHLRTRAGGNRGEHPARQITRYVGKYLYALNAVTVEENGLLQTEPVVPYLERVQAAGIRSSGILHRILAQKAAVNYMRLGVSYL